MKKLIAFVLMLSLVLTMCACGGGKENTAAETTEAVTDSDKASKDDSDKKIGVLSMLRMSEDEMGQIVTGQRIAAVQLKSEGYIKDADDVWVNEDLEVPEVVYYDSIDTMLMALNAGEIDYMQVYYMTGQYLCAVNDSLTLGVKYNFDQEANRFVDLMMKGIYGNTFSFLMMEGNEALRDEFSKAIEEMKNDGTMDKLVDEQIEAFSKGGTINPIEMPKIDGAETIKVAVSGAMPPIDYVEADGSPAGFNTAVLAEISNRIGKNIEPVVVDMPGRSSALASGTVDAVFWTRTNELADQLSQMTPEERNEAFKKELPNLSEEEQETLQILRETVELAEFGNSDKPEHTICTVPYYSDIIVPVRMK